MPGEEEAASVDGRRNGAAALPPTSTPLPPTSSAPPPPVVYIFDLDECLLLMESLRAGTYARATGADQATAGALGLVGEKLTAAVLEVADARLGFASLDASRSPVTLAEGVRLPGEEGGVFRAAAALLEARALLTPTQAARAAGLRAAADGLTGGWLASAGRLLAGLAVAGGAGKGSHATATPARSRPVRILAVTAGHILPTLAKLGLFGLAPFFEPAAVHSSRGLAGGKSGVFARLSADPAHVGASFCVVGDGAEEERAARARGWPFVRVGAVAAGGEFGEAGGVGSPPDALGRHSTPIPRLTVLDLRRAAGLLV